MNAMDHPFDAGVRRLLTQPRGKQASAVKSLLGLLMTPDLKEDWNSVFGEGSLFQAWTLTTVAQGVYQANIEVLRPLLAEREDWTALEIGAGNGELWAQLLDEDARGRIVAYDPSSEALKVMGTRLPAGIDFVAKPGRVETHLPLPEADVVVCALTLHHVAGRDAEERAKHGLTGLGKREALEAMRAAVAPRDGLVVINEADIHCEVDLAPGDPILLDRVLDSYVRRCAASILDDLTREGESDLADRWRHIVRHWCLQQIEVADKPIADRDVYELDVVRWREVIEAAGLKVVESRFSDKYGLFHQYLCKPA